MTLWRASFESRSFSFEAYGETDTAALAAMQRTIRAHARQYRLAPEWVREALDPESGNIGLYPITIGHGYRDGSEIA